MESIKLRLKEIEVIEENISDPGNSTNDFFLQKQLEEEKEKLLQKYEALEYTIFLREHKRVTRMIR